MAHSLCQMQNQVILASTNVLDPHPKKLTLTKLVCTSDQVRCPEYWTKLVATSKGIAFAEGQGPRPVVTPTSLTVRPGEPAEFQCTSGGSPPPIIMWGARAPANPLRPGIQQQDGKLTIPSAELSDAGTYYCTASNIHDTVNAPVQLFVEARKMIDHLLNLHNPHYISFCSC